MNEATFHVIPTVAESHGKVPPLVSLIYRHFRSETNDQSLAQRQTAEYVAAIEAADRP